MPTYFLDFRVKDTGGAVTDPRLCQGNGADANDNWIVLKKDDFARVFAGRNVLFATHGFNVSRPHGARSLGQLDEYLNLGGPDLFVAVLWPGDCWLPVVDYPFEGDVALDSGRRLADFCNGYCAGATSLSFVSHSLGARLILEAISNLDPRHTVRSACLTAGAINRRCLIDEYASAAGRPARVEVLASHEDYVLKYAFAAGDPVADLLHDDHSPFQAALGSDGPPRDQPQPVPRPWQIDSHANYGHGNYLPPGTGPADDDESNKWKKAADFMKRAYLGQTQVWPQS